MKQNEIQLIKTYRDEIKRTILKLENFLNEQKQLCQFNSVCYVEVNISKQSDVLVCLGSDYFLQTNPQDAIKILQNRQKLNEECLKRYDNQQQSKNMVDDLQKVYDQKLQDETSEIKKEVSKKSQKKTKSSEPAMVKSILKKTRSVIPHPVELSQVESQKSDESSHQQSQKMGKVTTIEGISEIREELEESQTEAIQKEKQEILHEMQIAFCNNDLETYKLLQEQIKIEKPKEVKQIQQLVEKSKKIQFDQENEKKVSQPKKKVSQFKRERMESRQQ